MNNEIRTNQREPQEEQPGHLPKKPALVIRIFRSLRRHYSKKRRKTEHQHNEYIMARWTRKVGIFTLFMAVIAGVTACILEKTDETLRATLRTEQRPWFGRPGIEITKPFHYMRDGRATFELTFALQNTGHSPAWVTVDPIAILAELQDWPIEQKRKCASAKEAIDKEGWGDKYTLFPKDIWNSAQPLDLNFSDIEKAVAVSTQKWGASGFTPMIVGCISYHSVDSETFDIKTHQTPFVATISTKSGATSNDRVPTVRIDAGTDIPVDSLRIVRVFTAGPAN